MKNKLDTYLTEGKTQSDFWMNDPEVSRLNSDENLTRQIIEQSNSPGFVQAQESILRAEQVGIDATIIAGLLWAQRLGDFRAGQFLSEHTANDSLRQAMENAANAVAAIASSDIGLMQSRGCQRIGTPPGMFVPGNFAPVD